jgi:hypothetical protein
MSSTTRMSGFEREFQHGALIVDETPLSSDL